MNSMEVFIQSIEQEYESFTIDGISKQKHMYDTVSFTLMNGEVIYCHMQVKPNTFKTANEARDYIKGLFN